MPLAAFRRSNKKYSPCELNTRKFHYKADQTPYGQHKHYRYEQANNNVLRGLPIGEVLLSLAVALHTKHAGQNTAKHTIEGRSLFFSFIYHCKPLRNITAGIVLTTNATTRQLTPLPLLLSCICRYLSFHQRNLRIRAHLHRRLITQVFFIKAVKL